MAEPIANINAEQATLGTMLMFPAAAAVAPTLTPGDFAFTEHAEIFCAIASAVADGQTPHLHLLAPHFAGMKIRELSGPQYLASLATKYSLPANEIDGLVNELRSYAGRRTLKALGEHLSATAEDPSAPISALCSEAIGTIDGIASTLRAQRRTSFDVGAIAVENMQQLKAGKKPDAIKTGLLDLDKVLGGWHRGELAIIGGRPSMGKAQALDQPVLLKDGTWRLMGEIRMGDELASIDGLPSRVSAIFPQGRRQLYRVTLSDGRAVEADGEHLWRVHCRHWSEPRVLTTLSVLQKLSAKRYRGRIWLDRVNGDFGRDVDLPLDAYVLGALIANGTLARPTPLLTTPYDQVVEQVAIGVGGMEKIHPQRKFTYSIVGGGGRNITAEALRELELYGVHSHDKFIPQQYMAGCRETRASLLRGLLDGDGWVESFGAIRYCTSSERLASDIQKLVWSLGGVCTISEKFPVYQIRGETRNGRTAYVLNLSFEDGGAEFLGVTTKSERINRRRVKRLTISSIEPSRVAEAQCITVTHPSKLYVTSDYVITHNSALIFSTTRQAAKHGTRSLLFSLEMRRETVVYRMLSDAVWNSETPIPYERIIRQERLTEWEIERIEAAAAAFGELPIRIDDQPGLTIAEICARSRRYADELTRTGGRLDVIAIDHLGKITASDRYAGNAVREIGEKTNALFNLGRELDVAMIVAAQLNRGNEKRENKRAEMSDVRDSGDIEQDADTMLFPYRAAYYLETQKEDDDVRELERLRKLDLCKNLIEINVVKNRNGPRTNIEFFCEIGSNVVRDMAK